MDNNYNIIIKNLLSSYNHNISNTNNIQNIQNILMKFKKYLIENNPNKNKVYSFRFNINNEIFNIESFDIKIISNENIYKNIYENIYENYLNGSITLYFVYFIINFQIKIYNDYLNNRLNNTLNLSNIEYIFKLNVFLSFKQILIMVVQKISTILNNSIDDLLKKNINKNYKSYIIKYHINYKKIVTNLDIYNAYAKKLNLQCIENYREKMVDEMIKNEEEKKIKPKKIKEIKKEIKNKYNENSKNQNIKNENNENIVIEEINKTYKIEEIFNKEYILTLKKIIIQKEDFPQKLFTSNFYNKKNKLNNFSVSINGRKSGLYIEIQNIEKDRKIPYCHMSFHFDNKLNFQSPVHLKYNNKRTINISKSINCYIKKDIFGISLISYNYNPNRHESFIFDIISLSLNILYQKYIYNHK